MAGPQTFVLMHPKPEIRQSMGLDAAELDLLSVEDLMVRYQLADAVAAGALVDSLSSPLYRFFCRHSRTTSDAADMLQEMWLRIHRVRHTYRPGSPLLPWVYAIANRVRIDAYRKLRRRSHEVLVEAYPDRPKQPSAEVAREIDELLSCLPEAQRSVLTMVKVHGLTIEEAASATRSTAGAVKQKVHRAYERLRKIARGVAGGDARA